MKPGLTMAVLLCLLCVPTYAQQDQDKEREKQQQEKQQQEKQQQDDRRPQDKQQQDKQQQDRQQQDRKQPDDKRAQDRQQQDNRSQQDRRQQQDRSQQNPPDRARQDRPSSQPDRGEQSRADRNQPSQRSAEGRRIPEDRFRASFGREHRFRVQRRDDRRFQYGGYWFEYSQPWPGDWRDDDDLYVDEMDGEYYLMDPRYPDERVLVIVVQG